jgi:hypothetical protein
MDVNHIRKDCSLDALAEHGNVAQFVSFEPLPDGNLRQVYCRLAGYEPNHRFPSPDSALAALLAEAAEGTINIRSYQPDGPRSREFVYRISDLADAIATARRLASAGLHVIANETIDVADGGVSGVAQGNVVEFAPDDTPRCVEKPGVASLPRGMAISILSKVYGFSPELGEANEARLEFSIHPRPRGWRSSHSVAWEYERASGESPEPALQWPNRFSRHIGDKAFGLLVAEETGLPVPRTTVFARRIAPFTFGRPTGSREVWIRTAPIEPEPGRYTTRKGWVDPFQIMAVEDPDGTAIASILCQAAVPARYSGAAIVASSGDLVIEGLPGEGDVFMLGQALRQPLPRSITNDIMDVYRRLETALGPVKFEWVHDGETLWVVQLHRGRTESTEAVLVPGEASVWVPFEASRGLSALRVALAALPPEAGITMIGEVGLTSHLADLVRKVGRPARITRGTVNAAVPA